MRAAAVCSAEFFPLLSPSGAAMLPGHPGQEGRHHGRQRDHLRRRPRAPEERHRTAGRGQVSPHRLRAGQAPPFTGRSVFAGALVGDSSTAAGPGGASQRASSSLRLRPEEKRRVLSAGVAAPPSFTDFYLGRALEAPGAVLRLRETHIPCSKRELEGWRGGEGETAPGNQPPSCWVFSFWGSLAEGRACGGGQGAIEAAPARAASRRSSASAFPPPLRLPLHPLFLCSRKANVVLETRQLAMKIFEDYTVSWYWIIM